MLLPCIFISSALVFAMLGIKNFAGVAVFAILYGFWSGSCMYHLSPSTQRYLRPLALDVSLIPSLLAQFSQHPGEHGYVDLYVLEK